MRCFVAIELDEGIAEAAGDLVLELKEAAGLDRGEAKWVRPELMHLTLKFLGDVPAEKVSEVCQIVKSAVEGHSSFKIEAKGMGTFGGRTPKVLWVGVSRNDALSRLQKDIEGSLDDAGWPADERAFSSHLTLARIRSPHAGRKLAELAHDYEDVHLGTMVVDSVCVFESELTPAGPNHTVLKRWKLRDSDEDDHDDTEEQN